MKVIIQEIYSVDAESVEEAVNETKLNTKRDSAIFGGESLGVMFHPVHLADAQAKFGTIQPAPAPEAPKTETDE